MKILVVDDHALIREGMRQVLKGMDEDLMVLEASTCAQAFELAAGHPDLDVVLLDYHLPDMNGLAALDRFGQNHPELPVIMVSGSVNPDIMRQVLSAGAAGFIPKTSKSEVLLSALGLVLAGEVYVPIESPRGELGCFVVSDGSSKPARVHMRDPSFVNLQALGDMVKGEYLADLIATLAMLDPVLGGIDR